MKKGNDMFGYFIKRLLVTLAAVFIIGGNIYGMGGGGGAEKEIPLPQKNYSALVTDVQRVSAQTSRISWDGKIYIQGKRGEALTTIPFQKLDILEIKHNLSKSAGAVVAMIKLKSGESIKLDIKSNSKFFGETSYGKFEIYIRDVKAIKFQ